MSKGGGVTGARGGGASRGQGDLLSTHAMGSKGKEQSENGEEKRGFEWGGAPTKSTCIKRGELLVPLALPPTAATTTVRVCAKLPQRIVLSRAI